MKKTAKLVLTNVLLERFGNPIIKENALRVMCECGNMTDVEGDCECCDSNKDENNELLPIHANAKI